MPDIEIIDGLDFCAYYSGTVLAAPVTAAGISSHTWSNPQAVSSVDSELTNETKSYGVRKNDGTGGTDIKVLGKRSDTMKFEVYASKTDAFVALLSERAVSKEPFAFADADGLITDAGTAVTGGNYRVAKMNRSGGDGDAGKYSVELEPVGEPVFGVVL